MQNERLVGISQGKIVEYKPASSLGGNDDFPVAIVEGLDSNSEITTSWIPDTQDLEPGTSVLLARIEATEGKGSHIVTQIIPLGD